MKSGLTIPGSATVFPFNSTLEELKYSRYANISGDTFTFNSTLEELKLKYFNGSGYFSKSFNSTLEELKSNLKLTVMKITEKQVNNVKSNLNENHENLCKVLATIFENNSTLEKEYWWDGFFYKIEEAINSDEYTGSIISYGKGDVGIINDVFFTLQTELKDPIFFSFLKNLQLMAIACDNDYSYEVEKEAEECLLDSLQKIKNRGSFFVSMYGIKTMAMRRINDKNWTGGDENPLTLDEIKNSRDE